MIRRFRIWLAIRRLERIVERTRNSYACESYRRHRAAALKGRAA